MLKGGKARFSDDTQMTLFTAEGMLLGYRERQETGGNYALRWYIYQAYLCWLKTQEGYGKSIWDKVSILQNIPEMNHRRAPGNTCLSALESGKMGLIDEPLNHSKGCGGVMRTAPLGFIKKEGWPFQSAMEEGAEAAAITHGNPMGWIPAGMLSDIVERCIYEDYDSLLTLIEDSLTATVEKYAEYKDIVAFEELVQRAIVLAAVPVGDSCEVAAIDEPAIKKLGEGWVGDEALAIAIYAALRYEHDLKGGLIAAANHSGDSDSTAAIAGNILGAWLGVEAIPKKWREEIELAGQFERITDEMLKVIEE